MVHIHKHQRVTKIVHNQRILTRPNTCPDSKKYIQKAKELKLTLIPENNKSNFFGLVGPFNFESMDQYNQRRKNVHIDQ